MCSSMLKVASAPVSCSTAGSPTGTSQLDPNGQSQLPPTATECSPVVLDCQALLELAAPDNPADLWLAIGLGDVPVHRPLMQGDVIVTLSGPVCVVSHACSMRRGADLHETQIVAPVLDHAVPGWRGHYDWMPLPGAPLPQFAHPSACLRLLRSEPTASLMDGQRVAVMADTGIHLLQQRMAFHLCRVVIDLAELAEHSAPVLVETDLLEEWVDSFGVGSEGSFHQFLDSEDRKLRDCLSQPSTRPQAVQAVRKEIRRQQQTTDDSTRGSQR